MSKRRARDFSDIRTAAAKRTKKLVTGTPVNIAAQYEGDSAKTLAKRATRARAIIADLSGPDVHTLTEQHPGLMRDYIRKNLQHVLAHLSKEVSPVLVGVVETVFPVKVQGHLGRAQLAAQVKADEKNEVYRVGQFLLTHKLPFGLSVLNGSTTIIRFLAVVNRLDHNGVHVSVGEEDLSRLSPLLLSPFVPVLRALTNPVAALRQQVKGRSRLPLRGRIRYYGCNLHIEATLWQLCLVRDRYLAIQQNTVLPVTICELVAQFV
jgi:hypothetical protein